IVVSVVTIAELAYGSLKHADPDAHRNAWEAFVTVFEVLAFDEEAARTHAEVRYTLRSAPIGERDLLIAAIALPRSLILVTHNVREFRRVPGLRVEDWVRGDPVILRTPLTNGLPTSTAGRASLHGPAREADVVLEGSRPGAAARLGVDYETLGQLNPRLVYCSISGYGQDGPYRDRVGHDVNYLGFAGVIGLTGPAGGPPVIPGVQIADIGGGTLMAAVGILAALAAREETGRGQFVDIAMLDGSLAWQVVHVMRYLAERQEPARGDTMLTGHHPCYAIYETRDGRHVTVGALEPHFWRTLCERLGLGEFAGQQFAEGSEREAMFARFRAKFRERSMAEWVDLLADLDI